MLQSPDECFLNGEAASTAEGRIPSDGGDDPGLTPPDSDLDYEGAGFWSEDDGEDRRAGAAGGGAKGMLAPRPSRAERGLPPRPQGAARERHMRQQVWTQCDQDAAVCIVRNPALLSPKP